MQLDNLTVDAPLGKSDHVMCFEFVCGDNIPSSRNRRYLLENGDYDQFNSDLMDLDWNELFCDLTVEEM